MADQSLFGAFVPTTQQYDISHLAKMDVSSPEFREFIVRLRQYINNIALVLNIKDSGYYLPTEFVNGQLWFANPTLSDITPNTQAPTLRQVFRMVVNFGALPNTASKSVAHTIPGITSDFTLTRLYAAASDTSALSYIPIPYASTTGNTIELSMDATNITITTTSNRTNYNFCYVIIEYIKD